jgi:hypothetical protein
MDVGDVFRLGSTSCVCQPFECLCPLKLTKVIRERALPCV